jgi:Polysaccharide deacetylase
MRLSALSSLFAVLLAFGAVGSVFAAEARRIPVPNLGFEEALTHWDIRERITPMSTAVAEAARTGTLGLRIVDDDSARGSSAETQGFIVTPGLRYRATFWARADHAIAGAYLHFHRLGDNQRLPDPAVTIIAATDGGWREFTFEAVAPAAVGVAVLEFHSFNKSVGQLDIDDIVIEELPALATTSTALPAAAAPLFVALSTPPRPAATTGPLVVVKLDDVNTSPSGWLSDKWRRVGDFSAQQKIKLSFGVITRSLEDPKPDYVTWLHTMRDSGWIEFWFHAYDHATHVGPDGRPRSEFADRDPAELKRRFELSQALAVKHLGAPFTVFGPPGGGETAHVNADTLDAVQADPNLRVILYPSPIDALGSALQARGKVRVLDRVWQINIEQPLFVPNYEKFVQGYQQFAAGRSYLVIERIIDFLRTQGAQFVTATELAQHLASTPPPSLAGITP